MATRFAGSRMLDERRRRRLAVETDLAPVSAPRTPKRKQSAAHRPNGDESHAEALPTEFPFRKLISPSLWKHWAIGFVGLLFAFGILSTGFLTADGHVLLAPGLTKPFAFQSPRMATFYSSLLLMLSGQLALLIWWVRSCSLTDFAGRYSIWMWAAIVWCVFGGSVATDAHLALSEAAVWCWDIDVWNRETLCWLFPALIIGNNLFWALQRDMRYCRTSISFLWISAIFLLAAGSLTVLYTGFENSSWHSGVALSAGMFGHLSLFLAMLFHTRFVIHDSAEPPPIQTSLLVRLFKRIGQLRALRLSRNRMASVEADGQQSTRAKPARKGKKSKAEAAATPKSQPSVGKAPKKKSRQKHKAAEAEVSQRDDSGGNGTETVAGRQAVSKNAKPDAPSPQPSAQDDCEAQQPTTQQRKADRESEPTQEIRLDSSEGPDLRGLSKKQRRLARKKWREQQRAEGRS